MTEWPQSFWFCLLLTAGLSLFGAAAADLGISPSDTKACAGTVEQLLATAGDNVSTARTQVMLGDSNPCSTWRLQTGAAVRLEDTDVTIQGNGSTYFDLQYAAGGVMLTSELPSSTVGAQ